MINWVEVCWKDQSCFGVIDLIHHFNTTTWSMDTFNKIHSNAIVHGQVMGWRIISSLLPTSHEASCKFKETKEEKIFYKKIDVKMSVIWNSPFQLKTECYRVSFDKNPFLNELFQIQLLSFSKCKESNNKNKINEREG